ncbi:MAG: hypothetical protein A4E65_01892 [Syntrophorhabdus sp. PtaU1.Bin153]|nr:MAG: hypothetical protein A4E65_01892 [Syntrophorhabdus sp. PtaU1.Bin153]
MGVYSDVYEFAARAGALEGFVYQKEKLEPGSLNPWVEHLIGQYKALSPEVRQEFQNLCDGTIGRAIRSLIPLVGEDHELIGKLKTMTAGKLPSSPDDFSRQR